MNKNNNNPNRSIQQQNISNCDSSSGISSSSATSLQRTANILAGAINGDGALGDHQHYHQLWLDEIPAKGIKELDIQVEKSESSVIQPRDIFAITGDNAIKSHNGQLRTGEILNGNQCSVDPDKVCNDTKLLKGSKSIGKWIPHGYW